MVTTHLVMFSFFDGATPISGSAYPVGTMMLLGVGI
jgi:hypothetical protein